MVNSGFSYREVIDAGGAGVTALSYLARRYGHSSLVEWGVRFERSEVLLEGVPTAGDQILRAGQTLVWNRPPWDEGEAPLHFEVVHEDEALLAVSKPAGLPTLPAGGYLDNTLLTLVQRQYPGADPVHRLGRYTSGLVLFGRTEEARASLTRALRERRVRKSYRALATGVPEWHRLEIRAPIGLVPHPRLGTVYGAVGDGRGKPSLSTVELVAERGDASLLDVVIATGRPHQIRIHLAFAGHPLVGDRLYGARGLPLAADPGLPGEGGYLLHAAELEFAHPATGAEVRLQAELPEALR